MYLVRSEHGLVQFRAVSDSGIEHEDIKDREATIAPVFLLRKGVKGC